MGIMTTELMTILRKDGSTEDRLDQLTELLSTIMATLLKFTEFCDEDFQKLHKNMESIALKVATLENELRNNYVSNDNLSPPPTPPQTSTLANTSRPTNLRAQLIGEIKELIDTKKRREQANNH